MTTFVKIWTKLPPLLPPAPPPARPLSLALVVFSCISDIGCCVGSLILKIQMPEEKKPLNRSYMFPISWRMIRVSTNSPTLVVTTAKACSSHGEQPLPCLPRNQCEESISHMNNTTVGIAKETGDQQEQEQTTWKSLEPCTSIQKHDKDPKPEHVKIMSFTPARALGYHDRDGRQDWRGRTP